MGKTQGKNFMILILAVISWYDTKSRSKKTSKLNFIKVEKTSALKDIINRMQKQPMGGNNCKSYI